MTRSQHLEDHGADVDSNSISADWTKNLKNSVAELVSEKKKEKSQQAAG